MLFRSVMQTEDVPSRAAAAGSRLRAGLEAAPGVVEVRGLGLLLAAELDQQVLRADSATVVNMLLDAGVVFNAVTPSAIRLAPSLLITEEDINRSIEIISSTLAMMAGTSAGKASPDEGGDNGDKGENAEKGI